MHVDMLDVDMLGVFLSCSPSYFFEAGLLLKLEFTDTTERAGQLRPRDPPVSADKALG